MFIETPCGSPGVTGHVSRTLLDFIDQAVPNPTTGSAMDEADLSISLDDAPDPLFVGELLEAADAEAEDEGEDGAGDDSLRDTLSGTE